jgi:hypothetical protein
MNSNSLLHLKVGIKSITLLVLFDRSFIKVTKICTKKQKSDRKDVESKLLSHLLWRLSKNSREIQPTIAQLKKIY